MKPQKAIKKTAKNNGVSEQHVREEMQKALDVAWNTTDEEALKRNDRGSCSRMGSLLLRNLSKKSPEWCPIIKRNQKTNGHPVQIMRHRIANNTIQEGSWALSTERRNAKE